MTTHLSEDQFARCFIGKAAADELEHLNDCAPCRAELDHFSGMISTFRTGIRNRVDAQPAAKPFSAEPFRRRAPAPFLNLRLAFLAAALFLFVTVPFFIHEERQEPPRQLTAADPNALMETVGRQLSRTLPAPMEPVMNLLPAGEPTTQSGGVQ